MRKFWSLLLLAALVSGGCNLTCDGRYDAFHQQIESNLRDDVAPKYRAALEKAGLPEDVIENRVGLVLDSADALKLVREGGLEAWQTTSESPEKEQSK